MRDEVDAATSRVLIDDPEALAVARAYCRRAMPEAEGRLELFRDAGMLFDLYDLEDEIERLVSARVALPRAVGSRSNRPRPSRRST